MGVHKWKVEYAQRAGGGRAMCRDTDCLVRHEQGGVRAIEKGALRIGRRVLLESSSENPSVVMMWHHAQCIFNTFKRSRKDTRIIQSIEDLEGFESIDQEDQDWLRRILAGAERRGGAGGPPTKGMGGGAGPARLTPDKRKAPDSRDPEFVMPKTKELKLGQRADHKVRKGDRVWTFCRVRPPALPDGSRPPAAMEFAVKSAKAELAEVVEEPCDGSVVLSFESAEHEKERIEMFNTKRGKRLKGWLRFPRYFEGKKQKLPLNWIQWQRAPPRLCGCTRQEWGHSCVDCGASCTRGSSTKVYGVCN